MAVRDIIIALGGGTTLAGKLGVKPPAISNWKKRGIPRQWWPALIDLAEGDATKVVTMANLKNSEREAASADAT